MIRAIVAHPDEDLMGLVVEVLTGTGRVEVVGTATGGLECLRLRETRGADVVLLDPAMPELSGIEVARRLLGEDAPPAIAFVTCRADHAAQAFDLGAVDYVMGTGDYEVFSQRLLLCLSRLESAVAGRESILRELREVVADLRVRPPHPLQRKLPVRDRGEGTVTLLDPADVVSVERGPGGAVLCTRDRDYPTYCTIEALERRLLPEGFFRANPGALLNANHIRQMTPNGDGSYDAVLGDETGRPLKTVRVSRARSRELLELLGM